MITTLQYYSLPGSVAVQFVRYVYTDFSKEIAAYIFFILKTESAVSFETVVPHSQFARQHVKEIT
jgi:hypothetical protein